MALDKMLEDLLTTVERTKDRWTKKVVIMFDESHNLLRTEFGYEAFLFRCVRVWLREMGRKQYIVAVFTGTTSRFDDYVLESDEKLKLPWSVSSRNFDYIGLTRGYFGAGYRNYPPFFRKMTIGSYVGTTKPPPEAD